MRLPSPPASSTRECIPEAEIPHKLSPYRSHGNDIHHHRHAQKQELLHSGVCTSSAALPNSNSLKSHRKPSVSKTHNVLDSASLTPNHERSPSSPWKSPNAVRSYNPQPSFYHRPTFAVMVLLPAAALLYIISFANGSHGALNTGRMHTRRANCPDYRDYSARPHPPYTAGKYALPFQRPIEECRLFTSPAVESLIQDVTSRMTDPDLARLFENAYPNTLDTTVRWHVPGGPDEAQSFVVTGDINAQWLRDCRFGLCFLFEFGGILILGSYKPALTIPEAR